MRRREFIMFLGSAAAARPLAAYAQKREGARVGILMPFATTDPSWRLDTTALVGQLKQLGWTEGRNLRIDYRWASGDAERIQASAKELVAQKPDVIVCRSTPVTAALLTQTRTIPIVFVMVSDPVGEHFVESLARPGGNATGFTNVESSMAGKWLELIKEIAPNINRIAFIFDPKVAPGGGSYYTNLIKSAPASFASPPISIPIHNAVEIEGGIENFAREPNGGLLVLPDTTTRTHHRLIVELAARHRIPAIYDVRDIVAEGGLISYGVDVADLIRRAAGYVDRVLKGAKPAELPVQLPTKFELVINIQTAKALGLEVSSQLQQRADEVIE
jgi:putative tryptophan/tyrosine transport system substrate-binding protein